MIVQTCQGPCEITLGTPIRAPPTLRSTRCSPFAVPLTSIGLIGSEAFCDKTPHMTLESAQPALEPWPHHSLQRHLGRFQHPAEPDLAPLRRESWTVEVTVGQLRACITLVMLSLALPITPTALEF